MRVCGGLSITLALAEWVLLGLFLKGMSEGGRRGLGEGLGIFWGWMSGGVAGRGFGGVSVVGAW